VTPLQPFVSDLPAGSSFGFMSFLDLDVIGHFVKGLSVRMLLKIWGLCQKNIEEVTYE
jgi:hypothetical protein